MQKVTVSLNSKLLFSTSNWLQNAKSVSPLLQRLFNTYWSDFCFWVASIISKGIAQLLHESKCYTIATCCCCWLATEQHYRHNGEYFYTVIDCS